MKEYLKNWVPKLKSYSQELDKLSKMYNQPWVLINELDDFIKIIFQEKGKLIVSKNGIVSDGDWEMVSLANSLLLNINNERRLYSHQFIDDGLMILKLDGFANDYFVLANQNIIPDLNIEHYLISKYISPIQEISIGNKDTEYSSKARNNYKPAKLYESEYKLNDGKVFQIIKFLGYSGSTEVRVNHILPDDGIYRIEEKDRFYEVQGGRLVMEYYIARFKQENGEILEIAGSWTDGITKGSSAWINGKPAPSGTYKKGWFSKVKVEGGKLV